eukprot:CAMPEP_0196764920 /NCGR_PEP_ID=MMETSP1095-20130614/7173_1 /TAXON_ID=96789 ORGANISM="Chromulina nebulosa, Strain UTEXLB2642" /NCGR_SAMPLE_ID=MMETSP1095 /ASSEMBLY_ACC=CAM_ASM_000446 /LENGTH=864 /DNA_ID=CAMNT_0042121777 /DNA_START=525 /DNA_END=3119 /DNA_ORIENTATION=-
MNDPLVLQQEGWHYEVDEETKQLSIKGVVYNEMKGVYSSPDSILGRATQQALFPDNTYGVDSGGDPDDIPTLTYDKFREFHSNYYHPSNSRVFFYGNDDPKKRLELLDEYLNDFTRKEINSKVQFQPKLEPRQVSVKFPIDPTTEPKHMISVNWVMNHEPLSMKEQLAIGVLDSLLLGTSTSELRKELTQSNLGEKLIGGGLSDELIQATFSIGLKGVKSENVKKVEELIIKVLTDLSVKGFEQDAIDAALNTLEFRLREFNTGGFPKGLSLMFGMMPNWIYDKDPFDGIRFEEALAELKAELKAGVPVFQTLLKKYLVDNTHRLVAEAIPDPQLESLKEQEEKDKLDAIRESLTSQQIQEIIDSSEVLKEIQLREDSPEAKASIPHLSLQDIEKEIKETPIVVSSIDDVLLITHDLSSNGILYADIGFDFSTISIEDIPYIPLFIRMLSDSGSKNYDEVTLSRKVGSNTGGIYTSLHVDSIRTDDNTINKEDNPLLYLLIRGKSTVDKIPVLFDLMHEMLVNSNLDNQRRAIEILRESKARKQSSVITSGHSFGTTRLGARFSFLGYFNELLTGITSVRESVKILDEAETNWSSIQERLERIRKSVVQKKNLIINLTGNDSIVKSNESTIKKFISLFTNHIDNNSISKIQEIWKKEKTNLLLPNKNEGFVVPSQVNYVVQGGQLVPPGEKINTAYNVITRYLSTGYLWDNVRVVGGAYGGFASYNEISGRLSFASYRDPNLIKTLQVYNNTINSLLSTEISPDDLTTSIIGTIGDLDSPQSVDQKGFSSFVHYLRKETSDQRQQQRNEILSTNINEVQSYIKQLEQMLKSSSIVVVGSQSALEQAKKELDVPLHIENALQKDN